MDLTIGLLLQDSVCFLVMGLTCAVCSLHPIVLPKVLGVLGLISVTSLGLLPRRNLLVVVRVVTHDRCGSLIGLWWLLSLMTSFFLFLILGTDNVLFTGDLTCLLVLVVKLV